MVDTSREAVEKRASVLYLEAVRASELGHGRFAAHYLEARDMLLALLSERDALRAAKEKAEAERDQLRAAKPCKFGGGNDCLTCHTCGVEYDYRHEDRPPCGLDTYITALRARAENAEAERDQARADLAAAKARAVEVMASVLDSPSCQCATGGCLSVSGVSADAARALVEEWK